MVCLQKWPSAQEQAQLLYGHQAHPRERSPFLFASHTASAPNSAHVTRRRRLRAARDATAAAAATTAARLLLLLCELTAPRRRGRRLAALLHVVARALFCEAVEIGVERVLLVEPPLDRVGRIGVAAVRAAARADRRRALVADDEIGREAERGLQVIVDVLAREPLPSRAARETVYAEL